MIEYICGIAMYLFIIFLFWSLDGGQRVIVQNQKVINANLIKLMRGDSK